MITINERNEKLMISVNECLELAKNEKNRFKILTQLDNANSYVKALIPNVDLSVKIIEEYGAILWKYILALELLKGRVPKDMLNEIKDLHFR